MHLTLPDAVLLQLRYFNLIGDDHEFHRKVALVDLELGIVRSLPSIPEEFDAVCHKYGLNEKSHPTAELALTTGMRCYYRLSSQILLFRQYANQIKGAVAKLPGRTDEAWKDAVVDLVTACNPTEFFERKQSYLETELNISRLQSLHIHRFQYKTVCAEDGTRIQNCLDAVNHDLRHKSLPTIESPLPLYGYVFVSRRLHDALLAGQQKRQVVILLGIGGGGNVTGDPTDAAWQPQAIIDALESYDVVYSMPQRRVMPESSGLHMLQDHEDYLQYMTASEGGFVGDLDSAYPGVKFRTKFLLTAESAGAHIGVRWLRYHPELFAGAYFRSALFDAYRRNPGMYMHRVVDTKEAASIVCRIFRACNNWEGELPPAKSRRSPVGQAAAYIMSVTRTWECRWDAELGMQILESAAGCQPVTCPILMTHGSDDTKSPFSRVLHATNLMRAVLSTDVTLVKLGGEDHCPDYDWPLDDVRLACLKVWLSKVLDHDEMI
ncbi:hypothetical protein T440DRAFT_545264 [Plenodomus tracheiphilus IPT5]|uniref:Uncharacterized protein n=1 Tax=Plenodomus tracheiphilus IPT5 TaxID=1408161 RepID=A0A6A7ARB1_9PLEO|nr:hypothetical protein T440DRAFT_545264 [Plenodomus tracheiphilus IPT5]